MTELSREEVLRVAGECFDDKQFSAVTYESGPYDIDNPTVDLMRFAAEMYAKGAEDMRERAAINHEVLFNDALGSAAIRALPISDSPNTFTPTNTEGEQG